MEGEKTVSSQKTTKSSAFVALIVSTALPAWAGTIEDAPVLSVSGGGVIFSDPEEGVQPPGAKAVTFTSTRTNDQPPQFIAPYQNIITDFVNDTDYYGGPIDSRSDVPNCLMANNPGIFCDSESGSGKRIKTYLTGTSPLDISFATNSSVQYPSVDYFTFGKTSNFTGARIIGLSVELLDANGNPMGNRAAADAVLFNLNAGLDPKLQVSAGLPDGLFGEGGNEGNIGFFTGPLPTDKARLNAVQTTNDLLGFGDLDPFDNVATDMFTNQFYINNFGTAFLDDRMVPDGLFWDDNDNPDDESALIAWNNPAGGGWTYGNIALPADQAARAQEIADALGVNVAALNYTPGGLVPPQIVALAQSNGLFAVDAIEDLRNANLNFTITVGNVAEGEFTLRIKPLFAPIIYEAGTASQLNVASALDTANVPYLGLDQGYINMINTIMGLSTTAQRQQALTQLGFTSGASYLGTAFAAARDQSFALGTPTADLRNGGTISSNGNTSTWTMAEGTTGFVSLAGRRSEVDATINDIGYETESKSIWVGLEKSTLSGLSFGAMVGAGTSDSDMDNGLGSVDADTIGVGLFARAPIGEKGAVQAMVGYQDLSYDSRRNIPIAGTTAIGETDGSIFLAGLKGSWMIKTGGINWGPMASLEYYDVSVDGYTEAGAGLFNLTVGDIETSYTLATVGLQANTSWDTGASTFDLFGHLAYTTQSGGDSSTFTSIGALPGFGTSIDGFDDEWLDIGLGMSATIGRSGKGETKIGGKYQGALFGNGYESHGVSLFVKSTF
ncbi:choice-of-anchor F family protein [Roseovarius pacificus]